MTENSHTQETPEALKGIKSHIDNFKLIVGWIVLLSASPVLLDVFLKFGPPWPDRTRVAYLTTIALWAILLVTYGIWPGAGKERLTTWLTRFFWLIPLFLLIYMALTAMFVVNAPTRANQIAKGFFMHEDQARVLKEGKFPNGEPFPIPGVEGLLQGNQWKAEIVYPEWTVAVVNLSLLASWLCVYACLAGLTSVFLLLQDKKVAKSSASTARRKNVRIE